MARRWTVSMAAPYPKIQPWEFNWGNGNIDERNPRRNMSWFGRRWLHIVPSAPQKWPTFEAEISKVLTHTLIQIRELYGWNDPNLQLQRNDDVIGHCNLKGGCCCGKLCYFRDKFVIPQQKNIFKHHSWELFDFVVENTTFSLEKNMYPQTSGQGLMDKNKLGKKPLK